MTNQSKILTKTELAKKLGVSRSSLYYKHKMPERDEEIRRQIESVLADHFDYGHKRIALELKLNKKRILRVMNKFGIKPSKRRVKRYIKPGDINQVATNIPNIFRTLSPIQPDVIWASDFTYIKYQNKFIYLATLIDVVTKEIVGYNISRYHNKELVLGALENSLTKFNPPLYLHSDQGSEYRSQEYKRVANKLGIKLSMSDKGSPWQNGYQESFYGKFKVLLGQISRFETLGELIAEIHEQMYYYNNKRIHTTIKMQPTKYRRIISKSSERLRV